MIFRKLTKFCVKHREEKNNENTFFNEKKMFVFVAIAGLAMARPQPQFFDQVCLYAAVNEVLV